MARQDKETLFSSAQRSKLNARAPLAVRMRPVSLEQFAGQGHFLGPGKLLTRMLEADRLSSVIFYGPPGTGKTSLARVIAETTKARFEYLSAPAASVKDIREVTERARDRLMTDGPRTVLFIDEIHRFNRAQQDVLLDDVENGVVTLIGATTENPFFAVNSPLISRSTVFQFEPLSEEDVLTLLKRALKDREKGLGKYDIKAENSALKFIAQMADGDARKALNALEIAVLSQKSGSKADKITVNLDIAKESIQQKSIEYDGTGDSHYDLASALQKSMRGSDPDATVYWLARMLAGGEDLRFIARRIAVTAAEDVGNADPLATLLAGAAVQISEFVGLPESQLVLAQAAIYVACAPKSNASAKAIWKAMGDVKKGKTVAVPAHLRDSHYGGAEKLGHGKGYKYPHDYPGAWVEQEYLSEDEDLQYYQPSERGREKVIKEYLKKFKNKVKSKEASKPGNDKDALEGG